LAHKRLENLKEIVLLQHRMESYFDSTSDSIPSITRTWAPPVDLYETGDEIHLSIEIPGVEQQDLKIEARDNVITVQGRRRFTERNGETFLQVERSYGPFQRTFRLPSAILEKEVKAEFSFGVLIITMKKDKRNDPKYTRVNVSPGGQ
jgi:HSP20 family protein